VAATEATRLCKTPALSPHCEYVAAGPDGRSLRPVFGDLFVGVPLPPDGRLTIGDAPGFGMSIRDRSMLISC